MSIRITSGSLSRLLLLATSLQHHPCRLRVCLCLNALVLRALQPFCLMPSALALPLELAFPCGEALFELLPFLPRDLPTPCLSHRLSIQDLQTLQTLQCHGRCDLRHLCVDANVDLAPVLRVILNAARRRSKTLGFAAGWAGACPLCTSNHWRQRKRRWRGIIDPMDRPDRPSPRAHWFSLLGPEWLRLRVSCPRRLTAGK